MGVHRIVAIFVIVCTVYRVGGEFETVYEVGIYGTRPRDSEDKAGVPSSEYYKYQELSEVNKQLSNVGTTEVSPPVPSVKKTDQGRIKNQRGVGPGTCYQCTTLSDTAQRDPGNFCYNISRYKEMKEQHANETGWEPPGLQHSLVSTCKDTHKYCQVRRVDYKVDNMTSYAQWSLERACVQECDPFCVSMGGRTKVTYCTSCCRWDGRSEDPVSGRWVAGPRADNCNVGNGVRDILEGQEWTKGIVLVLCFTFLKSY